MTRNSNARRRGWRPAAVVVALSLSLAAAACGSDDGDDADDVATTQSDASSSSDATSPQGTDAGPAATDEPAADEGAIVRIGTANLVDESTGVINFDPTLATHPSISVNYAGLVYDRLMYLQPDGSYEPGLAESFEVIDDRTVEVVLKSGLTFTDGTPVDAEAAKFSIERNKAAESQSQFSSILQEVTVEVVDETTFRLIAERPAAGFLVEMLAKTETLVVSPAAVEAGVDLSVAPVGAGPFMVTEFVPGTRIDLMKNPDYWGADEIEIAGIQLVNVPNGPPAVSALQAGEVDVQTIGQQQLASIGDGFTVTSYKSDSPMNWMPLCKNEEPLSILEVRQALSHAIDREAINQAVYGGAGEPAWALFPSDHPYFPDDLENSYEYDPEKARALLAEAGYADGFDIQVAPSAVSMPVAEIVQQQWAEIGVRMELVSVPNETVAVLVENQFPSALFFGMQAGLQKFVGLYTPGNLANLCGFEDPELIDLVSQMIAVAPGSDEAIELAQEIQRVASENVVEIWINFYPNHRAARDGISEPVLIGSTGTLFEDFRRLRVTD